MNKLLSSFLLAVSFIGFAKIAVAQALTMWQLVNNCSIQRPIVQNSNFLQIVTNDFGDDTSIVAFVSKAKIYIFDRFEKLLTHIIPQGAERKDTFEFNSLPSSDFNYFVEYVEEVQKEFKGHFYPKTRAKLL